MDGSYPSAEAALRLLAARGETLATAESLTGGLIAALITSVPGASQVFRGGVVSYATDLKSVLAGVNEQTLTEHGAVAARTAAEMAAGVAHRLDGDWGLATTGVAGPELQEGHPAGTVFVAVSGPLGADVRQLALGGSRAEIRQQTVAAAVELLLELAGMNVDDPDVM